MTIERSTTANPVTASAGPALPDRVLVAVIAGVTTALPPDGVWPVAAGKSAASTLQLVNPGEQDATATVTTRTGSGAVKTIDVSVPAGSLAAVDLLRLAE